MKASDVVGMEKDVSAKVTSNEPVLAERPIYFDFTGFQGGSVVSGWEAPKAEGDD